MAACIIAAFEAAEPEALLAGFLRFAGFFLVVPSPDFFLVVFFLVVVVVFSVPDAVDDGAGAGAGVGAALPAAALPGAGAGAEPPVAGVVPGLDMLNELLILAWPFECCYE